MALKHEYLKASAFTNQGLGRTSLCFSHDVVVADSSSSCLAMPAQQAVPPLLADYLSPPTNSLTLITGTLSATPAWLILRFLAALTSSATKSRPQDAVISDAQATDSHVTLISWLHNPTFWLESGKKLPINFRMIKLLNYLNEATPVSLAALVDAVIASIPSTAATISSDTLIIDGLDFLLASTSHPAHDLLSLLSTLRQKFSRVIITVQADAPFLHAQNTPLEVACAMFATSLAHQADMVMSLRELETGAAKDVSGILRVANGGQGDGVKEKECLYYVEGSGYVKVFERGA